MPILENRTELRQDWRDNRFSLSYCGECFFTEQFQPWTFMDREGRSYTYENVSSGRISCCPAFEGFEVTGCDCADGYGEPFRRAERIFARAFPGVLFILDRIETDRPVRMISRFVLNNSDGGLLTHVADDRRMVFRRGAAAMKFFTFPLEGTVNLRLLGREADGVEGCDYISEGFSRRHLMLYAFTLSEREEIGRWHIKPGADGQYRALSPGDRTIWSIGINPAGGEDWIILSKTQTEPAMEGA